MVNRKGQSTERYFRNMDISVAAIVTSPHSDGATTNKPGVKSLKDFRKLRVDVLGRVSEANWEPRQWRGAVYI